MHRPTQCPYDILAYALLLEVDLQKQPTTARKNKAVVREDRLDKFLHFSEGFRRCHKLDTGLGSMLSGNLHTILLPVYHNQRNWAEKEVLTRTREFIKVCMTRQSDLTLF